MMEKEVGRSPSGRAFAPSASSQQDVSPVPASIPNALRVVDYINQANPERVAELYRAERYIDGNDDGWGEVAAFTKFKARLNDAIGVQTDMRVSLTHYHKDWEDELLGVEDYINVSGANAECENWAIEFRPWGEWKLMPVDDKSGKALTTDQIAMHLYDEMTWAGWEEQGQERLAEIEDRMEEIERGLVNVVPFGRDSDGNPKGGDREH